MEKAYKIAFDELGISSDVFDSIVFSSESVEDKIVECFQHCFDNVPALRVVSALLMQYVVDRKQELKHNISDSEIKLDADDNDETSKGKSHGNTRLPYGLAKGEDIDTTGMSPRDVWEALSGHGYSPEYAYKSLKEGKKGKDLKTPKEQKTFKSTFKRTPEQEKAIKDTARKTRNLKKEQLYVFDKTGKLVHVQKEGERNSVSTLVGHMRDAIGGDRRKGMTVIHNHPDGGTFSAEDLHQFGYGAMQINAASPEGTYTLTDSWFGNDGAPAYSGDWVGMRDALEKHVSGKNMSSLELRKKAREKYTDMAQQLDDISEKWVNRKKAGADDKELNELTRQWNATSRKYKELVDEETRRLEVEPFDSFYKENAAKFGFEYTFTPVKKRSDSRYDSAWDEWIEDNLEEFATAEEQILFHKYVDANVGKEKGTVDQIEELYQNWRQDGGPGSGNHGHKGVPGQVGGSAPSDAGGAANATKPIESMNQLKIWARTGDAIDSPEYEELNKQRAAQKETYEKLEKELDGVPFYQPEDEWDDDTKEFVKEVGKEYAPVNPRWSELHEQKEKAKEEWDETNYQMNELLLKDEPPLHQTDFKKPKDASGEYEGFKTNDTGTSLDTKRARLVEMPPEEYLARCAAMFNDNQERSKTNLTMQIRQLDAKNIAEIAENMRNGEKYDTPWLDESGRDGQEGRHRAAAAYELGIRKIPVFLFEEDEDFKGLMARSAESRYRIEKLERENRDLSVPDDIWLEDFDAKDSNFDSDFKEEDHPRDENGRFIKVEGILAGNDKKWNSEKEYREAKKSNEKRIEDSLNELDEKEEQERKDVLDSFGGSFYRQKRIIRNDITLSEEEKERKLKDVDDKSIEYGEKINDIYEKYDKERNNLLSEKYSVFDLDYEFDKHIDGEIDFTNVSSKEIIEATKDINPGYWGVWSSAYHDNCQRCVIAAEARFRGYDVQANRRDEGNMGQSPYEVISSFVNPEVHDIDCSRNKGEQLLSKMKEWGAGSRALVSCLKNGTGHIYNVAYNGNELFIIDTQSNAAWSNKTSERSDGSFDAGYIDDYDVLAAALIRTDNVDMSSRTLDAVKRRQR